MEKVNFFPKRQGFCLVYTNQATNSRLFHNMYTQLSPKNSLAFRLLRTKLILFIRSFFKVFIPVPVNGKDFIGLLKHDNSIFFELHDHKVTAVWKKGKGKEWEKTEFLGYQLISEYTLKEFRKKRKLIVKALQRHWEAVNNDISNIHGDLTHFNILYNEEGELFFIDSKSANHSKLFDFFYFYSYYNQCISKCTTLGESDRMEIINDLKSIIKDICRFDNYEAFKADYSNLGIPNIHGLNEVDLLKKDFHRIFENTP